jgi:hypothetical protein
MEVPVPDAKKLLQSWMEWERGEVTPGRVMANLKTGGLPLLLESLVSGEGISDGGVLPTEAPRAGGEGRPKGKGQAPAGT